MTETEFIRIAKEEYNYDEDGIKELLRTYEEMKEINAGAKYEDVLLIPQPVY